MSSKRLKGVSFSVPFVYGTLATPLSSKQKEELKNTHTHRWTVFVRGLNGEDLSYIFRKVTFKLHETYEIPSRVKDQAPFEVTETGWGEFEIAIKIQFPIACNEKQISLFHNLRLHPVDPPEDITWGRGKSINSIVYDEIVFNEPYETLYQIHCNQPPVEKPLKKSPNMPYSVQAEEEEIEKLEAVKEKLKEQLASFQRKLLNAKASSNKQHT